MGMGQSAMPAAPRPQFAAAHDPIKAQAFTELRAKLARYLGMQMWAQLEAEVDARAMTLLSIPNLPASPYSEVRALHRLLSSLCACPALISTLCAAPRWC